jgi:hypothetical protein
MKTLIRFNWLLVVGACALALSMGASACSGDESKCGPGNDEVPVIIEDPADMNTFWIGLVGVDELKVVGSGAAHNTLVQAHFTDFTNYTVQLADRDEYPDYPACTVQTSRPVTSGDPIPLSVTSVTFLGLSGGTLVLEPDEFGSLPTELLPQSGFEGAEVSISVAADGAPDSFPGFSDVIPSPAMPVLTRLGDHAPVYLTEAPSLGIVVERTEPLEVNWEPSGADYVEIKIIPGAGSETPFAKLRCITFDDGCLEIPAAALTHLAQDAATNFRFRIEHHFFGLNSVREGDQVVAATQIDSSASLEGIVLR